MKGEPNEPRQDSRPHKFHIEPHGCDLPRWQAHLGLGWQECGQVVGSLVCGGTKSGKHQDGNRTTLLVNMRQMPAKDFYEATLSVASKQTNVLDILTQLPLVGKRFRAGPQSRVWRFIQQLPFMATLLGALRAGVATAAAPLAMAVQNFVKSLDDDQKAQALSESG